MRAGYVSRGTASATVPFSPETIGRHERGDVEMTPDDAVTYAEFYRSPDILLRYCAGCPVGQKMGRSATDRELPLATLRIRRLIANGMDVANRLEEIAFDGEIDDTECEDFAAALDYLQKLAASITDIMLIGMKNKSAAPGATESGNRRYGNN